MSTRPPTILATSMGFNRAREPWRPSPVFRYAFDLARASRPRLCFISTGTGDRQDSVDAFHAAFADAAVDTSHLALFDKPNVPDIAAHLRAQDVIWVDRGSVANLLAVWRVHGLDDVLRECWESGVVLGGESAGSLCWFAGGTTDSFGEVRAMSDGLGLLPYANAVHYSDRRASVHESMRTGPWAEAYATDAGAGLHFEGTELVRAIADRADAGAYHIRRSPDGDVDERALDVLVLKRLS